MLLIETYVYCNHATFPRKLTYSDILPIVLSKYGVDKKWILIERLFLNEKDKLVNVKPGRVDSSSFRNEPPSPVADKFLAPLNFRRYRRVPNTYQLIMGENLSLRGTLEVSFWIYLQFITIIVQYRPIYQTFHVLFIIRLHWTIFMVFWFSFFKSCFALN